VVSVLRARPYYLTVSIIYMSNIDRQIANVLVKIHREIMGGDGSECRWYYSGHLDIYHCPHTAIFGKEVMDHIPSQFVEPNAAQDVWKESPESEHTL